MKTPTYLAVMFFYFLAFAQINPQSQSNFTDYELLSADQVKQQNNQFRFAKDAGELQDNYTENLREYWDGKDWAISDRMVLSYNANRDVTERKNQNWINSQWIDGYRTLYSYQGELPTEMISQTWKGDQWRDDSKILYSYDSNGNEILRDMLSFNNDTLFSITRYEYFNDNATKRVDSIICTMWKQSIWSNKAKYVWIWDEQNRASIVYNYWWKENSWVQGIRISYNYFNESSSYTSIQEEWNGGSYNLKRLESSINDSSDGKFLYFFTQVWDGKWRNETKSQVFYDDRLNVIEELNQAGNVTGTSWVDKKREFRTYDNENRLSLVTHQILDGTSWINDYRDSYSYTPTGIIKTELAPGNFELYNNYPNPFNPATTIRFSLPQRSQVSIKVFDILGNEVATLLDETKESGSYSLEFDGTPLVNGIYIYRLVAGNFKESRKMLLLK